MKNIIKELENIGSPKKAIKFLHSNGYTKLSDGQFSVVFLAEDNSHVIKVQTLKDLIWWEFINYVKENPNLHFPVVEDIVHIDSDKKRVAVSMEVLVSISNEEWKTPVMRGLLHFLAYRQYTNTLMHYSLKPGNEKRARQFYENHFNLANAIDEAADLVYHREGVMDLHRKNFMKRTDNTIVITDPGY